MIIRTLQNIMRYTLEYTQITLEYTLISIILNANFRRYMGVEIVTTDLEILARLQEIEKRMEKMEATLESINNVLKKVEQNTYFGCYVEGEKLD